MTDLILFREHDQVSSGQRRPIDLYEAAGLRMNPFATSVDPALDDRLFVDRGLVDPPSPGSTTLVQLIGHKGAGKTTQLMAWRTDAPGPYHYVPPRPYRSRWARPPVAPLVYADEVDRMPRLLRWWWFRQLRRATATAVVGTHRDLTSIASRAGLQVITYPLDAPGETFMAAVFARRFAAVEINGPSPARLDAATLRMVHQRAGGSLRIAEVLGHEHVAAQIRTLAAETGSMPGPDER